MDNKKSKAKLHNNNEKTCDATFKQSDTSLKWNSSGELSSLDMAKILEQLSNQDLVECDLTCPIEE